MLNIGVLAPGSEHYYLSTVAHGVEDYYLGGEVPGRWVGRGAQLLSLAEEVRGEDLVAVLADRDPRSGTRLGCATNRKVPGFDLTFSTPKSVSVLFGLGDRDVAGVVRDAHEEAVDAALGYLERHAVWSRRGRNGIEEVAGDGLVGAAFRHRTSRAGDPHLHTHVLVANTVRGPDDRWRTLDFRHFYVHAKTAGYLYEAHLRDLLTNRLGVEWRRVVHGTAELTGVPDSVTRLFSTRRGEIEAALAARGETSARAAQFATLATRRPKDRDVDAIHLCDAWSAKASEAGFDYDALTGLLHQAQPQPLTAQAQHRIENSLTGVDGLTERASTFDRLDVLRAWCDHLPTGAPVTDIEDMVDTFLAAHPAVVPLKVASSSVIRSANGRVLSSVETGRRWSTRELLALEQRTLDAAAARVGEGCVVTDDGDLARSFLTHPTLSTEQAQLIGHLCRSGNGVDVVTAAAGAGKTFAIDAAREAWERSGYRVLGAALAARAAAELQTTAGIPSTTLDALLGAVDRETSRLDRQTVVVVDEAAMVGTRKLARLLDHANDTGAKVVLVGDPRQLPEIDAGGLLSGLARRLPGVRLTDNRRQQDAWERQALRDLRDGDIDAAVGAYRDHGRITLGDNAEDTRARMVADWWAARLHGEHAIMLAGRRSDVDDLNRRARTRVEPTGLLHGPTLTVDGTPFQAGDQVMTLRNDRRLHVRNGGRGTIEAIDVRVSAVTVAFTTGETAVLPPDYLAARYLTHAYAMTVHKAQGLTCDRAFTLGTDNLYREQGYVAMSRGRIGNHLYVVGPRLLEPDSAPHAPTHDRSPEDLLLSGLARSKAQTLAVEYADGLPLHGWSTADLLAEQRKLRAILAGVPPDRAHDARSLERTRDALTGELAALDARHHELGDRHRTWRERRHGPETELLLVEAKQSDTNDRLARIEHELDAARSAVRARETFTADHAPDTRRLEQIGEVLTDRIERSICRAINDPPNYLKRALGEVPADRADCDRWIDAATMIETYRLENGITDKRSALGPEPRDPISKWTWQQACWDVEAIIQPPAVAQPLQPVSPERDLGIGLDL